MLPSLSNLKIASVFAILLIVLGLGAGLLYYKQKTYTLTANLETKNIELQRAAEQIAALKSQQEHLVKNAGELKVYYEKIVKRKETEIKTLVKLCMKKEGGNVSIENNTSSEAGDGKGGQQVSSSDELLDLLRSMFNDFSDTRSNRTDSSSTSIDTRTAAAEYRY